MTRIRPGWMRVTNTTRQSDGSRALARYRIRKVGHRWLILSPSGRRSYRYTWRGALTAVDRRITRQRASLARSTQADYALAADGNPDV